MCSDANPRAALAEYIRQKTDNGNQVVDYLHDVLNEKLDGVKHGHRTRAADILTEYGDLAAIRFKEKAKEEKKARPAVKPRKPEEREDPKFDAALARVIRDKTNDTEDVANYLINTMNGVDSNIESGLGKIHHQQRVSAAIELLRRAYDHDPRYAQPSTATAKTTVPGPVTPEVRPNAPDPTVIPAKAGIHPENPASDEEPTDYLAIVKRVVESMGPIEEEEEDPNGHKPDYSMWDMIEEPLLSEISDEHAAIGAALFHEAIERDRLWKQANAENPIPTRKDHDNYDDG